MKRKRLRSLKSLKAELDRVFSVYVRRRGSENGIAACVSCGAKMPWQRIQAGHYVRRQHLATRWDEKNCWPQCFACNVWRRGNYAAYSAWLIKTKGADFPRILVDLASKPSSLKRSDLEELLNHYKKQLDNLHN